jgi:multidrug efflux pump subunit AcrA (membrane-fusion protein)
VKAHRCIAVVLAVSVLGLAACSRGDGTASASAEQPRWLAVAHGQVDVQGGRVLVTARTGGVVKSIAVQPGDQVQDGQALARLDSRAARIAAASAQAGVAQARAHYAEVQVELQQAERRAPRVAAAAKAGAASGDAAAQAQVAMAMLVARQAAAKAALDAAGQQLAMANLGLDETTLRANSAGVIVASDITLGQAVSAQSGKPLFAILPDRPRIVRAQLDADVAGAIHRGMHAEVVRDSGGGPAYPATVLWVGQVLQQASMTRDPLQRALANDVECVLLLDPVAGQASRSNALRIGQRVLVKFPGSRESVPKESR